VKDTILIVEDEELLGSELVRHHRNRGLDVVWAKTLAEARTWLVERRLDPLVALSDMNLPDGNALDLLETVRGNSTTEWILLTGFGTIPDSVRALRLGAYDFLEKPCPTDRLDLVVTGAARSARAQRRLVDQAVVQNLRHTPDAFGGSSPATRQVHEMLRKLSAVPLSAVVIGGETGTGKGLAARILHYSGQRAAGPLVEVNCAALPQELLESELFGHAAGAFTGAKGRHRGLIEQANGGTLFLDEIGDLDLALQAKVLKAIEDHHVRPVGSEREVPVDVQIFAASNRDLARLVEAGTFRSDLYHRLCVFRLDLPPLRERMDDLDELVPLFVAEYNAKAGKRVRKVPEAVWAKLRAHDWPGNVRELRNVVERCVLFADDEVFPERWLQLPERQSAAAAEGAAPNADEAMDGGNARVSLPLDGSMTLDEMERSIIVAALERSGHNVSLAARMLGTTRQTLRYRIQRHGLKAVV
jgi:DNA-binding NtrC family response regulator